MAAECAVEMEARPRLLGSTSPSVQLGQKREGALVKAAQGGSNEAMEELFRRHWRGAHRAAYLVVHDDQAAEDIAQKAFISAIRSLDRFDRRRPFAPWLHRIVVNRAIDWTRAKKARREVSGETVPAVAPGLDLDALADSGHTVAALKLLGPEQRAVIVLRYLLDYTPGEIAGLLDLPRGTVNSRLRRGLDALADVLPVEQA
ncbi:MAG: RNA polymerase sigma factor [Solirubrobacterales bacterium]